MATVSLNKLTKRYGKTEVLHGIDLDIADGEFVVLVGPSGCGKSTTLRMIAGLEDVSDGTVEIGGRVVNRVEPKDRDIAMVFQNYAIYPHMSVRRNIGFGLKTAKISKEEKAKRIEATAETLGMTQYLDRKPSALSGGQRQRVAIGRAMVRQPSVFLFDEPLSNLDAQLRTQTRIEIKKLHQRLGTTVIFVTHDQVEAMTLADRIVIMKDGAIMQIGTPSEVYHSPANTFVARFIGAPSMNLLPASGDGSNLRLASGAAIPGSARGDVLVGIRPEDLHPGDPASAPMQGKVILAEPLGAETLLYVDVAGAEVIASGPGQGAPGPGDVIGLSPVTLHIFDAETGTAIR
ncbi:ABC transporter ATP-binding protein [Frigidibacter sp. ROC022]|uniref:ABC transporter ATP-binding protein n=1 Tax=Frigidibacter sp. ROC022 TaxID=2971796 RepID=UPI00215B0161|nr:sn-glycerol-3-phosphate ABC transporter ATP-binding protein UgpC [Frigidibacter sp. ROC022]MCR8723303.1 sn-glycerol-3-phosphate ABC transporter ATP-binding protein UgpC [Frigidibacter sp. ROC022]